VPSDFFSNMNLAKVPYVPEPPQVYAFNTLVEQVRQFEATLRDGETVGAMLASFGQSVTLNIQNILRAGQYFCFEGTTTDGDEARLVQHFTQASIPLIKMKVEQPRTPIGFATR
jgi:hypothetical protein